MVRATTAGTAALAAGVAGLVLGLIPGAGSAAADPRLPDRPNPPGPATVLDGDGIYGIGTDIVPGTYTSAGPAEGTSCYWRRIGADDTTLANALSRQAQVVRIDVTDVAFKTTGCQPWQLTDGAVPPADNPPWLSQLQLRQYLDMLNGLAGQSGNGQLPPY